MGINPAAQSSKVPPILKQLFSELLIVVLGTVSVEELVSVEDLVRVEEEDKYPHVLKVLGLMEKEFDVT